MIGDRPLPGDGTGTVTGLTIRGIPGLLVIGIGSAVVIVLVTGHALGGCAGVDAVDMAIGACGGLVHSF